MAQRRGGSLSQWSECLNPGVKGYSVKTVLIYRDELLPISETFIQSQVSALSRYRAQYAGVFRANKSLSGLDSAILAVPSAGNPIEYVSKRLYYRTGFAPRFYGALRETKPRIIHAHFAQSGRSALHIAKRLRIPLVVTLHGHDVTVIRDYQRLYRGLWKDASLFICVSEFIRRQALAAGFPESKLRVLYNGIRLNVPTNTEKDKDMILFVGRLVEKKGCIYLLHSMLAVSKACPGAHLVVIGDGPKYSELLSEAHRLGIPCKFLGSQSLSVVKAYQEKATIVCVPSVTAENGDCEGLPTVVLEAIAAGATVVGTNHAGIPEVIAHEQTGLLVPERMTDELAKALIHALGDENLRSRCVALGRERIRRDFDAGKQAKILETIYDEVSRVAGP